MLSKGAGCFICRIQATEAALTSLGEFSLVSLLRQCSAVFGKEESLVFESFRMHLLAMSRSKIGTTG